MNTLVPWALVALSVLLPLGVALEWWGGSFGAGLPTNPDAAPAIQVRVTIDFGDLHRPQDIKVVSVQAGSSVLDATRMATVVEQGWVCCDVRDIKSLHGVACDPEAEGWWLYEVNGKFGQVGAFEHPLMPNDEVRWIYRLGGSQVAKTAVPYVEQADATGTAVRGRILVPPGIAALPPYPVHKNHDVCGPTAKGHPCRHGSAVAWIDGVPGGKPWPGSLVAAPLDQRLCVFEPHVVVARAGSHLEILNSDAVLHTVQAIDQRPRSRFNLAMPNAGSRMTVTLDEPGVLDVQCNAGHPWMKAHIVVVANPYVSAVNGDGTWEIAGVPPGTWEVAVFHDWFGVVRQTVTVGPEPVEIETVFRRTDYRVDLKYTLASTEAGQ